jgi:hypothetical protein
MVLPAIALLEPRFQTAMSVFPRLVAEIEGYLDFYRARAPPASE